MNDLIARLRRTPLYYGSGEESDLPEEAADALAASQAEVARLRIVTDEMVDRGAAAAIDHLADDWWPPDEIDAANMARAIITAALAASQPQEDQL
jgi:hypothetical protein